ncbi:MAG: 2-phospho-L-lactate transferase [Actinomycetes bacterium]
MHVVALSGGVGGARFLRGLLQALPPDSRLTVIGNTGDDITLFGLRVCPDLDTVMYTLGGGIDDERGWGRIDESWRVKDELAAYGALPQWFGLGDRDLATHIYRTQLLGQGLSLTEVTRLLSQRWGLPGAGVTLLPMSDARIETHVVIVSPETGERQAVHFQEWWVRWHAEPEAQSIVAVGAQESEPAPGVLTALAEADVVVLPPSNPVVSIGTILAVPGLRAALVATEAPVVGVSPILGGAPVRGMADACLRAIGVKPTAQDVGELYSDFLDGWLVDDVDAGTLLTPAAGRDLPEIPVRARPLLMTDVAAAADIAAACLALAEELS